MAMAALVGAFLLVPGLLKSNSAKAPEPAGNPVEAPLPPPQEVLVRFRRGLTPGRRDALRRGASTRLEETLPVQGLQVVDPQPGLSPRAAAERLERSDDVLYAEPNFSRAATITPNDGLFEFLWGLHNSGQPVEGGTPGVVNADIDAPEAWDITTGSAGITVGVIDSGVDSGHPDLAPNIWRNPGESGDGRESNGVDDDSNGLVDDARGWDWVDDDSSPSDAHGHGTHVAGTIGARGNDGTGVAGVSWQGSLLPLRVLNAQGSGTVADLVSAYTYAGQKQIRVVNASLGGAGASRAEQDAIRSAPGTLFVVAAGNDGGDNDISGSYPCNYDLANVVCVAASDKNDALADFSNFGRTKVDLAAPGVSIASSAPGGRWQYMDGTSMATPHVAGAAALVWARDPGASVAAIRAALLGNVDVVASHAGKTVTGGRLNAHDAVTAIASGEASGDARTATPGDSPAAAPSAAPAPVLTPAPPPTPAPSAATAPDRTAPRVTVRVASRARLRTALRSGIRVRIGCTEACTVRLELVLDRRIAKRLRLGSGRRAVVVARGRGGRASAGSTLMRVRFTASARRRLARVRSTRLELRTRAADRAGNARSAARRFVRLRR